MLYLILLATLLLQPAPLYIVSPDFKDGGNIPTHCTCDGANTNPILIVHGIPEEARSLTLIVEDVASPVTPAWFVWNVPPMETLDDQTLLSLRKAGTIYSRYQGPCPENESAQTFAFKVYALDTMLALPRNVGRAQLEKAMQDHIIASGKLEGTYSRSMVLGRKNK